MNSNEKAFDTSLNAIVHKDYSGCNPIQISVYEDKMYIWNDGIMVLCKACYKYLKLLSIGDTDKTSVKNNDRSLTERELKRFASILKYMKGHDRITNKIGRELTGKSESSVKRYLNRLCEVDILKSEGSTSDTEYFNNE